MRAARVQGKLVLRGFWRFVCVGFALIAAASVVLSVFLCGSLLCLGFRFAANSLLRPLVAHCA